jgi:UDP-2,3-diacylglucosamine pyrophosphatase LpxH
MTSYRSIWISDLHLGSAACKAEALLDFLQRNQADNLYLVGDIVEGWNLGPSWFWSAAQYAVVEEIRAWCNKGVRVVFLPGNHDELATPMVRTLFGPVLSHTELIHRTEDGRRMLVMHGHQFHRSLNPTRWLPMVGSRTRAIAVRVSEWYERERAAGSERAGQFTSQFKNRVRRAVNYITDFDDRAVIDAVRRNHADGVICGHTHHPEHRLLGPIWYVNDGDWVDSCTALVEERDGALRLVHWNVDQSREVEQEPMLQVAL